MPGSRWRWVGLAFGFFLLDIASKVLAVFRLQMWEEIVVIPGFFSLTLTTNRGIAFSLLAGVDSPWKTALLSLAALLALGFIIRIMVTEERVLPWFGWGLSLVAGGILGNIVNRIWTGSVVDFLDFHLGRYTWPTFNLADSFISVGAVMILWYVLWHERKMT